MFSIGFWRAASYNIARRWPKKMQMKIIAFLNRLFWTRTRPFHWILTTLLQVGEL
jgi:hypothetical protein